MAAPSYPCLSGRPRPDRWNGSTPVPWLWNSAGGHGRSATHKSRRYAIYRPAKTLFFVIDIDQSRPAILSWRNKKTRAETEQVGLLLDFLFRIKRDYYAGALMVLIGAVAVNESRG